MIQIQQDIGMDVLFIRFNPDYYKNVHGKPVRTYVGREYKLLDLLQSLKNSKGRKHYLEIIYLFYDQYDGKINIDKLYY